jgi:hypothetical protein
LQRMVEYTVVKLKNSIECFAVCIKCYYVGAQVLFCANACMHGVM